MHPAPVAARPKRRRLRRAVIASTLAVTLTVGGGTAWALDRFVIDHVEIADVAAYEASQTAATASSSADATTSAAADDASAAVVTDTSYTSSNSSIAVSTVVTGTGDATVTYYVADVSLSDATELRSAFAQNSFGENITENTSDIAADNNAIFAING